MTAELWFSIIQFFIGIIIVLALLFGLMEASRKYDRFHENSYIVLASGYFFLIVWALLRALSFDSEVVVLGVAACKVIGFLCLTLGFLTQHKHTEEDIAPAVGPGPTLTTKATEPRPAPKSELSGPELVEKVPAKASDKEKEGWTKLLSADQDPVINSPSEEAEGDSTKSLGSDSTPPSENKVVEQTEPAKTEKQEQPPAENPETSGAKNPIDLSYLANRKRRNGLATPPPKTDPAASPNKEDSPAKTTSNDTTSSAPPEQPTVTVAGSPDGSKTGPENAQSADSPTQSSNETPQEETREELMDDLFPLTKKTEVDDEPLVNNVAPNVVTALPGEKSVSTPEPKQNRKANPLPAAFLSMVSQSPLAFWPEAIVALLALVIFSTLIPHRDERGNSTLLLGFLLIAIASGARALYGPLGELPDFSNSTEYIQLGYVITEVVGFSLIGTASWQKIKGRLTHHFLTVVSTLYFVLLGLTVLLARFIVHDSGSLNLLLLLMTGILISFLPIIHSFAYNHPMSNDFHEMGHD